MAAKCWMSPYKCRHAVFNSGLSLGSHLANVSRHHHHLLLLIWKSAHLIWKSYDAYCRNVDMIRMAWRNVHCQHFIVMIGLTGWDWAGVFERESQWLCDWLMCQLTWQHTPATEWHTQATTGSKQTQSSWQPQVETSRQLTLLKSKKPTFFSLASLRSWIMAVMKHTDKVFLYISYGDLFFYNQSLYASLDPNTQNPKSIHK